MQVKRDNVERHRLYPLQHKYRLRQRPLRQSMHSGVGEEVEAEAEAEDKLGEEGIGMMHEEEADSRAPLGSFAQRAGLFKRSDRR